MNGELYAIVGDIMGLLKNAEGQGHLEWGPANNRVRAPINWALPESELIVFVEKVNRVRAAAVKNEAPVKGRADPSV